MLNLAQRVSKLYHSSGERPEVAMLYLDLDGTVRYGPEHRGGFVNSADDVSIYPEALELMRRWKDSGGRIVGVTNQGGIALSYVTVGQVREGLRRTQELCDGLFDQIAYCPHHPSAPTHEQARCWCRKPSGGLLVETAMVLGVRYDEEYPVDRMLMVGDRPEDFHCATSLNVDFKWAHDWREGR